MNILYDLVAVQPSTSSKFHGGGEYGKVVFQRLIEDNKENKISCIYNKEKFLDPKVKAIVDKYQLELIHVESNEDIQMLLNERDFDKFYSALPYRFHDINFNNTQFIFTIHGLRGIEMPTDRYEYKFSKGLKSKLKIIYKTLFRQRYIDMRREQFQKIIQIKAHNKKIIVPSNHTKYALLNNFPKLEEESISVLYSPRKIVNKDLQSVDIHSFGVEDKNYFLLISGDRWIKNTYRAVLALDELYSKYPDMEQDTLIAGVKDKEIFLKAVKNKSKFKFVNYVKEEELESLYKEAYCFIYPTLNEGFGYPPLECMKYGTPVISSTTTSIPEICRDGVLYFNPYSKEELQNRVLSMVLDSQIWRSYSIKGLERSNLVAQQQDKMLDELIKYINS